jgi:D-serine dehydratase
MMPLALLKEEAVLHNVRVMADYCTTHNLLLAPHAKTTMSPQLLRLQMDNGAWGMTVATVTQMLAVHTFGIRRVLVANEVVDTGSLLCLRDLRLSDPGFEVLCLVDSEQGVRRMDALLAGGPRLPVLLEMGPFGGRGGCRTLEESVRVAKAIANSASLRLAGIETYEGVLTTEDAEADATRVGDLFEQLSHLLGMLRESNMFGEREEILVSAGSSMYFDRVVDCLADVMRQPGIRLLLRCGSYVTYESGIHSRRSPLLRGHRDKWFVPALEVWGAVLSVPEASRAIIGYGKRDLPYDIELPFLTRIQRHDGSIDPIVPECRITSLNDQHAILDTGPLKLHVGDLVACEVAHPCGIFEKWRVLPVVKDYKVVGYIETVLL